MKSSRATMTATALLGLALLLSSTSADARPKPTPTPTPPPVVSSDGYSVHAPVAPFMVYEADLAAGLSAHMPVVHGFDSGTAAAPGRNTFITVGRNADYESQIGKLPGDLLSLDRGNIFNAVLRVPGIVAATRRADGSVISIAMTDGVNNQTSGMTPTTRRLFYQTSTDNGRTLGAWQEASVDISPEQFAAPSGQLYPDNPITGPDGTLYLPTYAVLQNGNAMSSFVLQSTDGGASWTLNSVIARGTTAEGGFQFNETALAFTQAGDVLAVMRNCLQITNSVTGGKSCGYVPLQVSKSPSLTDPAWSAPTPIDAPGFPSMIRPRLTMLPNGILVLQAGRQDTWLVTSEDGSGDRWTNPTLVYRNQALDQNGQPVPYPGTINEGSSGNSGIAWVQSNRVISAADTCHSLLLSGIYQDKCTWRSHVYTLSDTDQQGVVRRPIDILTPGSGKLDLTGKAAARKVSVAVTNSYAPAASPRTGPNGAIDGSTEPRSGAATAGGPGEYLLTLERDTVIDRIGLAQWIGRAQESTVAVATSPDGPWTPVWETGVTVDQAMRYRDIDPVNARYVKVTTPGSDDCPSGMAAPCSMLNEIEIYGADLNTFENDPLMTWPRDYTSSAHGVRTTDVNTAGGGRVLELSDTSTEWSDVRVSLEADRSSTKVLELNFKPHWYGFDQEVVRDKFIISLTGVSGRKAVTAYEIAVADDGSLHERAKRGWREIAPAGTVPGTLDNHDAWSRIRLDASGSQASISVNGTQVVSVKPLARVSGLTGYSLAADTDKAVDDQLFYIDEVLFTAR